MTATPRPDPDRNAVPPGPSAGVRAAFSAFWLADHVFGQPAMKALFRGPRAAIARRLRSELVTKGPGAITPLVRRRDLPAEEFVRDYVVPNRPVVLEGAALDWPAARWTPDELGRRFPDDEVLLIGAAPEDVKDPDFRTDRTTLADIVEGMRTGGRRYARFNPLLQNHPELVDDMDRRWFEDRAPGVATGRSWQLFMGGQGTTTAVHCAISSNLFVQLHGTKRWLIFSPRYNPVFDPPVLRSPYFFSRLDPNEPDLDRHPLFAYVDGWEVILNAGDVLYNPPFYWHWVTNLSPSIGVGYRWFAPTSIARSSVTQALLTMMATNPPFWVTRKHRQNFSKVFSFTRRPSDYDPDGAP